ncbi:hypothetical protein QOT17_020338 [Balamuthia mandrillaris]
MQQHAQHKPFSVTTQLKRKEREERHHRVAWHRSLPSIFSVMLPFSPPYQREAGGRASAAATEGTTNSGRTRGERKPSQKAENDSSTAFYSNTVYCRKGGGQQWSKPSGGNVARRASLPHPQNVAPGERSPGRQDLPPMACLQLSSPPTEDLPELGLQLLACLEVGWPPPRLSLALRDKQASKWLPLGDWRCYDGQEQIDVFGMYSCSVERAPSGVEMAQGKRLSLGCVDLRRSCKRRTLGSVEMGH